MKKGLVIWFIVVSLLDLLTTALNGVDVEVNKVAVVLWLCYGFWAVILLKVVSVVGILCMQQMIHQLGKEYNIPWFGLFSNCQLALFSVVMTGVVVWNSYGLWTTLEI